MNGKWGKCEKNIYHIFHGLWFCKCLCWWCYILCVENTHHCCRLLPGERAKSTSRKSDFTYSKSAYLTDYIAILIFSLFSAVVAGTLRLIEEMCNIIRCYCATRKEKTLCNMIHCCVAERANEKFFLRLCFDKKIRWSTEKNKRTNFFFRENLQSEISLWENASFCWRRFSLFIVL